MERCFALAVVDWNSVLINSYLHTLLMSIGNFRGYASCGVFAILSSYNLKELIDVVIMSMLLLSHFISHGQVKWLNKQLSKLWPFIAEGCLVHRS